MIRKYWNYILLFFSSIAAIAFFFFRVFKPSHSNSSEKLTESLLAAEKSRLSEEKSQLEKKNEEIEKKEYSDEEIEDKYNS